jgi:signal transduction histidine kinase
MASRSIELHFCDDGLLDIINNESRFLSIDQNEVIKDNLCTDYKIYESIFYHLMQNAIKYSPTEGIIKIEFSFKPFTQAGTKLNGYLVTRISD